MDSNFSATPLGNIAQIEMGQSPDSSTVREGDQGGTPFLQGNAEFGVAHPTPRFSCAAPMKMSRAGDVLISVRAPVGAMNIADRDYCIGRGLAAVRVAGMSPTLAAHMVSAATPALRRVAQGTTFEAINKTDLASLVVMAPPQADREALGFVLDTLDASIRETEAIIEKLKQVKRGLLHDLLTRGIDADGELRPPRSQAPHLYKDSPLGWIPRDWTVGRLGAMAEVVGGVTLGRSVTGVGTVELPYLRVANVQDGYLDLGEIKTIRILASELPRYRLEAGDVLMNEGGDFDKLGRGVIWSGQIATCLHQNHVFRVRCHGGLLDPRFLAAYSSSGFGKAYFVQASKQTTNLASINSTQLKAFPLRLPSLAEQHAIINGLAGLDHRIEAEAAVLTKYCLVKHGLMDDLLTGRVRVTPLLETTS